MERIRGKLNQYQQDIRKDNREKMMAEQRVWKEMPSVIVQLPYRIDHSDWTYIEELLDSITQQDIAILDKALITYIEDKYNAQFDQPSPKQWQQPLKFNILRIVMRLRIAKNYHVCKLLKLLEDANQSLNKEFTISKFQVLLKLIKELAIFLEVTDEAYEENNIIWSEENCRLMNHVFSNLQIYRFDSLANSELTTLLNSYNLYYVCLIADRRIKFKQYLTTKNVDEIYQLINKSHNGSDTLEIAKSIDIINKIISCLNNEDENTSVLLHSLQILLIDGYESCKKYTSNLNNLGPIEMELDFTIIFFKKLLTLISNTDILTIIKIIQFLAKLIELSDNFIKAIFLVRLPPTANENVNETQVIILRPKQFTTYTELILFQMQNILCEVRYKTYWLISNILGSDKYFSEYGLQFLQHVYCKNYLYLQRGSTKIQNEIYFCILNYLCNIRNRYHISDLIVITETSQQGTVNTKQQTRNSFYYFVDILMNMLEKLSETLQNEGLSFYHGKEDIFMHRIIYSLYNLLKVVKEENKIEDITFEGIMNAMESNKINLYMQQISEKIQGNDQISLQIQSLVELTLKFFSTHQDEQALL